MEKNNENANAYVVPAAIVVAGLLIAGAVVYIGGTPGGSNLEAPAGSESVASPVEAAKAAGVNERDFNQCLAEGKYADVVSADLEEAINSGLGGTPTSAIVTSGGEQYFVEGALPADLLSQYVDAALLNDDVALAQLEAQYGVRGIDGVVVASPDVKVVTAEDHIRGSLDASVKIVEYSDLECPFCKRFHPEMKAVMDQYDGNMAWVYRHLPLESIHPSARPLAEGSECVAELGGNDGFWRYVDYVFEN
ncbi:MAG: thioredoxin domain-containing protein [bacterium]|nr:thioredoxin domain-containing protein [bacterium]